MKIIQSFPMVKWIFSPLKTDLFILDQTWTLKNNFVVFLFSLSLSQWFGIPLVILSTFINEAISSSSFSSYIYYDDVKKKNNNLSEQRISFFFFAYWIFFSLLKIIRQKIKIILRLIHFGYNQFEPNWKNIRSLLLNDTNFFVCMYQVAVDEANKKKINLCSFWLQESIKKRWLAICDKFNVVVVVVLRLYWYFSMQFNRYYSTSSIWCWKFLFLLILHWIIFSLYILPTIFDKVSENETDLLYLDLI